MTLCKGEPQSQNTVVYTYEQFNMCCTTKIIGIKTECSISFLSQISPEILEMFELQRSFPIRKGHWLDSLIVTSFISFWLTILNDVIFWGAHSGVIGVLAGPEAIFAVIAGLPDFRVLADREMVRVKHPLLILRI